ncbi:MAG: hypothetical protein OER86_10825, partial [Phycisphaerae bacterium]|nr:hypothetical protein [Phycisphaerae bacterium]
MIVSPVRITLIAALLISVAWAEDEPAAPAAPIELHVRSFLKESMASGRGRVQDKIFTVKLLAGRRLQMVPIKPLQVDQPFTLDPSTVRLGGGRFVAWYIPQPVSALGGAASVKSEKAEALKIGTTIPRLARECVLKPDGTLHWKLARVIPGASTASGTKEAYVLLLDRKRIKRPVQPRPVRRTKSQSAAAYNAQRQAIAAKYRQEVQTFVATTKVVSSLPKEFSQPVPALIWAVFDVSSYQKVFSLSGASPVLNWQVPYADLNGWRALCTGRGKSENLSAALKPLLAQDHPLSRRAAVTIITSGTNLASVGTDPELLTAIGKLMTEADEESQKTLAGAVSAGAGTAPAATGLLVEQMGHSDPAIVQRAMAGLITSFKASKPDEELVERLTAASNRLLALEEGPDLARVLLPAVELSAAHPSLTESLAGQIDLLKVSPKRREEMVGAVCDHAADQRLLAEVWLNGQLLAAVDPKVRGVALAELKHPAKRSGASGQSLTALRQRMTLRDAKHQFLSLLRSEDTGERELAWRALPRFRTVPPNRNDKDPKQPAVFQAVTEAAVSLNPAPIESVQFFRAQAPSAFRAKALAHLAGRAQGAVPLEAMAILAEQGGQALARLMGALEMTERENAARAWYQSPQPPPAAGPDSAAILGLVRPAGRNPTDATKLTK